MNKAKYLNDVLSNYEAEELIEKYENTKIENFGTFQFLKSHADLEKLNMQAVKNALNGSEDFIMESFSNTGKIKNLLTELITSKFYRTKLYPIIKEEIENDFSVKSYILLYHEAVVLNLLENFTFYSTGTISLEDYIIDLVDYCYTHLTTLTITKEVKDDNKNNRLKEIEFNLQMSCISIIRYITDHLTQLSFPIRNHIMNVKDFPMLLVHLIEIKPWIRLKDNTKNTNQDEIFENKRWINMPSCSYLPKLEAQVWIAIFNLFMNQDNTKKYEITEFRKKNLLKIKKYMNETLFDAIPPLKQLFRALEEMGLMDYSSIAVSNPFVVQIVPQLEGYYNNLAIKTDDLAEIIKNNIKNKEKEKEEYELIANVFAQNNLEYFMDDPKCGNCGLDANHRCSRCKTEWYCSKKCQKQRWKEHKEFCQKLFEMEKENNNEEKLQKEQIVAVDSKKLDKKFNELD